ncbi:MAG: MBL fold metallo-hydrolase [Myxococcales bacterium]|nr:MBL fold metallo-hydrolase [Myxococcales bacterium]
MQYPSRMAGGAKIVDIPLRFARCQLILGDVPTLVDTGTAADVPRILRALAGAGLGPTELQRIILTHADGDHAGGAWKLQQRSGAEVVAHQDEAAYFDGVLPAGFGWVKRAVVALSGRARRPEALRWVRHGEQLDGAQVVHTPGHISLLVGDALIAGDAFSSGPHCQEVPRVMTADPARSRDTIRELAEHSPERAFSGHGAPIVNAGARLRALAARLR